MCPSFPGELYLGLVQSKKARAKLVRVDPSAALAMPGVVDYLSHTDVPGSNIWGLIEKDEEIFASKEVCGDLSLVPGISVLFVMEWQLVFQSQR